MFEVFFVDNADAEHGGVRYCLNWEQLGFTCTGEATDGERALSLLRHHCPDLLVSALHLPYLDGLELCRRVRQHAPRTRLLLVADSERAEDLRSALEIGVDGFLVRPLRPGALTATVLRLREALEREQALERELEQLRQRAGAFAAYERLRFLSALIDGTLQVGELYDLAQSVHLDLRADEYCFLLCRTHMTGADRALLEQAERVHADLRVMFDRCPQFAFFSFHRSGFVLLLQSDAERMDSQISFCVRNIRRSYLPLGERFQWTIATADPVSRVSALSDCFEQACKVMSCSFLMPGQQLLTVQSLSSLQRSDLEEQLKKLSPPIPLSEELERFLRMGTPEESQAFAQYCVDSFGAQAIEVPALCRYLMLRVRLAVQSFVLHSLHLEPDRLFSAVADLPSIDQIFGREGTLRYLTALLQRTVELRNCSSWSRFHPAIRQALRCIEQNFTDPGLSLSRAAEAAGLSPNYFSTLFRKEMGVTFGEYLTQRRLKRAKELLRSTSLRSAQVARAVGYQDPHYFSNLFRRTQGCTPRAYREGADAAPERPED